MRKINFPIKIALFYFTIGISWILLSDKAILMLEGPASGEQITRIQNYKGVFFITLTSIFLFLISYYYYKKQEKLSRANQQNATHLNNMLESITDGFFAVDKDWKITHINNACARLFGTSREMLMGINLWSLFSHYTDSKSYQEYTRAVRENITVYFEDYISPYNTWFQINAYPFQNGLAVYFRDISRQKQIQGQLMLGKSNLDALINNTNDLIWSIDKELKLLSFNKPFSEVLKQITPGLILQNGTAVPFPEIGGTSMYQEWISYYNRAFSGERFSIEYLFNAKGLSFNTETSFNPIYNEADEIIGVGCFARDISERKKNEEERLSLIRRLVNQNKDLEEFSFIASHNLRSPVASILGLLQIFNKKEPGDQYNLTVVENLETTAKKLDEIIVDLTTILDIRHRIDEAKELVSFESIMDTIYSMLSHHIRTNDAKIETCFSVKEIVTVKSYLTNILFNLISNAIKYGKKDTPPEIKVSTEIENDQILLKVSDNGIGLDLEKYGKKLFMPYKRFHNHVGGKGIGLYLVKSQIEALDGNIRITSAPGMGTSVSVYLKTPAKTPANVEEYTT